MKRIKGCFEEITQARKQHAEKEHAWKEREDDLADQLDQVNAQVVKYRNMLRDTEKPRSDIKAKEIELKEKEDELAAEMRKLEEDRDAMDARSDHLNNRYNKQTAILAKCLKESQEFDAKVRVRESAIKEVEAARVYAEQDRDQLLDVIDRCVMPKLQNYRNN